MARTRQNYSVLKHLDFLFLDFICIELAFFLACQIRQETFFDEIARYIFMAGVTALAFVIIVLFWNLYSGILRRNAFDEIRNVAALVAGIFVSLTIYCFVTKTSEDYSRAVLLTFLFMAIPLVCLERLVVKEIVRKNRKKKAGETLLFIKEEEAEEKIAFFNGGATSGVIVTGIFTYEKSDKSSIGGVPVLGSRQELKNYVDGHKVNCVFIHLQEEEMDEYIDYMVRRKILVYRVLRNLEKSSYRYRVEEMNGYKTLSIRERELSLGHAITKRTGDVVFSILGILVTLPITLVTAVAIWLEDRGPVIYKHKRVGQYGKEFYMYKFRSMKINADKLEDVLTEEEMAEYRKEYKVTNDRRVTRVGRIIRKFSIDELPQLINILKGELSFIGPRPVLQEETLLYGDKRELLLSVRPGLTGYWQAYGRNNVTYESGERQAMELYYIENFSWWFNVKIFFRTIKAVITAEGAE